MERLILIPRPAEDGITRSGVSRPARPPRPPPAAPRGPRTFALRPRHERASAGRWAKGNAVGRATRFKPGVLGNATGSTHAFEQVRALARQHSPEAFKTLVELMRLTDQPAVRLRAAGR